MLSVHSGTVQKKAKGREKVKKETCTYCCKRFPIEQLRFIDGDDSPHLMRMYCSRCYEEVKKAKFPWDKK